MLFISTALSKRLQRPGAFEWGSLLPQDVEIPVMCANLEKRSPGTVPAIDHFFDLVQAPVQPKANRSLVRFAA